MNINSGSIQKRGIIDLLGLTGKEALKAAQKFIEQIQQQLRRTVLLITGWGRHSPGHQPVIKPIIIKWLDRKGINYWEENSGAVRVRLPASPSNQTEHH